MAEKIKTNLSDQHNPLHSPAPPSPVTSPSFSPASPLFSSSPSEQFEVKQSYASVFTDQILMSFFKTFLGGLDDGRPLMLFEFVSAFHAFLLQFQAFLPLPQIEGGLTVTFATDIISGDTTKSGNHLGASSLDAFSPPPSLAANLTTTTAPHPSAASPSPLSSSSHPVSMLVRESFTSPSLGNIAHSFGEGADDKERDGSEEVLKEIRKLYKSYLTSNSDMMCAACLPHLVKIFCEDVASLLSEPQMDPTLPTPAVRAVEILQEISGICSQVLELILWPAFLQSRYFVRYKARSSLLPAASS
jgi:hypothetical protein